MSEEQKKWFSAAIVRALRTISQTAIASIGTAAVLSEVSWLEVASASVLAGIISLLMSIAGLPEVESKTGGIRYVSEGDFDMDELTEESVKVLDEGDGTSMIERDEDGTDKSN